MIPNRLRALLDTLEMQRLAFKNYLTSKVALTQKPVSTTMAALAWAIIVESALLTDQLEQDMRESAAAKGCCSGGPGSVSLPYFLPNPPPEAPLENYR